jgi:hypothetical protein
LLCAIGGPFFVVVWWLEEGAGAGAVGVVRVLVRAGRVAGGLFDVVPGGTQLVEQQGGLGLTALFGDLEQQEGELLTQVPVDGRGNQREQAPGGLDTVAVLEGLGEVNYRFPCACLVVFGGVVVLAACGVDVVEFLGGVQVDLALSAVQDPGTVQVVDGGVAGTRETVGVTVDLGAKAAVVEPGECEAGVCVVVAFLFSVRSYRGSNTPGPDRALTRLPTRSLSR